MGVVIHDDFWAAAQSMPESQRAGFIYAICAYSFDGTEPVGSPKWLPTFIVVKDRLEMGAKASERGRAMANARWGKKHDAQARAQADAHAYAQASETRDAEVEVEVEVEKEINTQCAREAREIVAYLNAATGKAYKPTTPKTRKLIANRLGEGFTVDDFKKVINRKCAEWLGTDMEKFLRPETLFGTKFEGYLNQRDAKGGGGYDIYDR